MNIKQLVLYLIIPIVTVGQDFRFLTEINWEEKPNNITEIASFHGMKFNGMDESDMIFSHKCNYDYKVTFSFLDDKLSEIYIVDSSWKRNSVEYVLNGSRRQFSTAQKRFSDLLTILPRQREISSEIEFDILDLETLDVPSHFIINPNYFKEELKKFIKNNYRGKWISKCPDIDYDQYSGCAIHYTYLSKSKGSQYKFEIFDKGFGYITQLVVQKE